MSLIEMPFYSSILLDMAVLTLGRSFCWMKKNQKRFFGKLSLTVEKFSIDAANFVNYLQFTIVAERIIRKHLKKYSKFRLSSKHNKAKPRSIIKSLCRHRLII